MKGLSKDGPVFVLEQFSETHLKLVAEFNFGYLSNAEIMLMISIILTPCWFRNITIFADLTTTLIFMNMVTVLEGHILMFQL